MSAAQYRAGAQSIQPVPRASTMVINAGDMLFLDTSSGQCKPAAQFTWTTDLATTQAAFAAVFLGIARSSHISGDTSDCQVDMSAQAIYACACVLATFHVGDLVTPAQDGSNNNLSSNVVQKTATAAAGIGRVHHYVTPADTTVSVKFGSAFNTGSGHKNAGFGA